MRPEQPSGLQEVSSTRECLRLSSVSVCASCVLFVVCARRKRGAADRPLLRPLIVLLCSPPHTHTNYRPVLPDDALVSSQHAAQRSSTPAAHTRPQVRACAPSRARTHLTNTHTPTHPHDNTPSSMKYGTFFFFAGCCLLMTAFIYFCVPVSLCCVRRAAPPF